MGDTYTHGHHPSVLRSHTWRTAENSAAYLLAELRSGQRLLDLGCGPGTITVDLAQRVSPGTVTGIDASKEVIDTARATAAHKDVSNVSFEVGDLYSLDAPDSTFDVVHAHQVLQHLTDPVAALVEARRVLKPGGVLAVRDSDYAAKVWAPRDRMLDRWLELYHQVTTHNGAEADAGRFLLSWARQAGFTDAVMTSSTWTYADAETRQWWGELWAERVVASAFAEQAISYGYSTADELSEIAGAWRRWKVAPDATFIVVHGEVIAHR
ncbi:MAG: methyltransferase domain-containing protein [Acidimicrobiales bacterium]|jgi:ubiquinone/menaquinone biosynthesis C-methylase UbiE